MKILIQKNKLKKYQKKLYVTSENGTYIIRQ